MRSKKMIPWLVALMLAGGSSAAMAGNSFNDVLAGGLGGAIGAAIGGSMGGQTGAVIGGGLGGAGGAILAGGNSRHYDDHYRGRDGHDRSREWQQRPYVHYGRHVGHYDHGRDRHDWRH